MTNPRSELAESGFRYGRRRAARVGLQARAWRVSPTSGAADAPTLTSTSLGLQESRLEGYAFPPSPPAFIAACTHPTPPNGSTPHRQSVRAMPSDLRIGRCGFLSSSAWAVMIGLSWQKPHAGTCSVEPASAAGAGCRRCASPSSLDLGAHSGDGVTHDPLARPLMITAHAAAWPRPTEARTCRPRSLRRT